MQDRSDEDRYAAGKHPGRQPDQAEGERRGEDEHPMPEEARRPTPGQAEGERGVGDESTGRRKE
jgi:hypothetical protein